MNELFHAINKAATPAGKPVYGSEEWLEEMRRIGRIGFIYGHMGPGGIDHDKQDAIDNDENLDVFPEQSGRK